MGSFESEWRARFEYFADRYDADHLVSGWSESGLGQRVRLFHSLFTSGTLPIPLTALDLGCGPGTYVRFLGQLGAQAVVGIDYSLPSIRRALASDAQSVGRYTNGEAYHLPFRDHSFDLVVCMGVFQALQNPQHALDEILRVLRPGGHIVLDFLNDSEVIAQARKVWRKARRQPARLLTYKRAEVQGWFVQRGVEPIKMMGVYLAPSKLSWAVWVLQHAWIVSMLEMLPGLSLLCAHAFIFVGRKGKMSGYE